MGARNLIQRFSLTRLAKNNKWVALPILTMIGAGGAMWGLHAMITQGLACVFNYPNYLTELWYYRIAISCAATAFCLGTMELLRVLGKTLILDEAEKVRVALFTFEQTGTQEVKEIIHKIMSQLRGRPDKSSIGEMDYLILKLQKGEDLLAVLIDYHNLLAIKIRSEAMRNPVINAWRLADTQETSNLLSASIH